MNTLRESARDIPVIDGFDIVVVGGSCTGVFAAVRAARLGAKVAIVEQAGAFGGTATNSFVCIWHALTDITYKKQIISGLTEEMIERLKAVPNGMNVRTPIENAPWRAPHYSVYVFNTEEMKIELDSLVLDAGVTPYLHTRYSAPYIEDGELKAVIVENRSGRFALRAKFFIDATADGFLGVDAGMEFYTHGSFQPATAGARVYGWDKLTRPNKILRSDENRLRIGGRAGWEINVPGSDISNWCKSQFVGDCADGDVLTQSEIASRRQVREMMNILRESDPHGNELSLIALSSMIGIRETRQLRCSYQITGEDICYGKAFDDAIGYCAYPVDVHIPQMPTTFRYLDGYEKRATPDGKSEEIRWRTDKGPYPTYWQIPFRSILPEKIPNLMVCGRCIDSNKDAHGALRVMISLNQTGEAAGVACYEALSSGKALQNIDFASFRRKMKAGGSIIL